jgi:hypothetical protein
MSKPDKEDIAREKFLADLEAESDQNWIIQPTGDSDFEKGCRAGINAVLATMRDWHFGISMHEDNGSYEVSMQITETLCYAEDFDTVIQFNVDMNKGDDDAIRAFSAYLRAQADEVDKAIGFRWENRRKKVAPEEDA